MREVDILAVYLTLGHLYMPAPRISVSEGPVHSFEIIILLLLRTNYCAVCQKDNLLELIHSQKPFTSVHHARAHKIKLL